MTATARGKRSRGNGEGSVYQRADGQWCAAVTLDQGKRKVLYGKTRQEVAAKLRKAQVDRDSGLPPASERLTLAGFLEDWLRQKLPHLRPLAYRAYESKIRKHIIPDLGRERLVKLSVSRVQNWLNDKSAEKSVERSLSTVRSSPACRPAWSGSFGASSERRSTTPCATA